MRDAGKAVLLVSVELDEILSLADRILVMFDGTLTGELAQSEADERRIGCLMAGIAMDDTSGVAGLPSQARAAMLS
jgi:simple sugar transport system ATP-binding protein